MAQPARTDRISRRNWLLAGLGMGLFQVRAAEPFTVSYDGDNLRVAAPSLHFLSGKPLERLKNGDTVTYLSQLTLYRDAFVTPLRRANVERFVVSYNIWADDKFSVTVPGRRSAENLSLKATESWCLETLAIGTGGLSPDTPFWLRFDMHTATQRDLSELVGDRGLNLHNLVMLLGRRGAGDDPSWTLDAGPLRLADLVRTPGRGRG